MIFECGHDKLTGVGRNCMDCHNEMMKQAEEQKLKPKPKPEPKPKKKMGRPRKMTTEERREKYKQWFSDNAVARNEYARDRNLRLRGSVRGKFVVVKDGLYKQNNGHPLFGPRSTAKIYRTSAFARRGAVNGGEVVQVGE